MKITKCDKQCIFVNLIGFCCLDNHVTNTKHIEAQCQRGRAIKSTKSLAQFFELAKSYQKEKE